MRTVEYLSPTSISLYYKDVKEFYYTYLADRRVPRIPQTQPMSVGSSFDAHVKAYLHEAVYGKDHDPKYSFDNLFTAQVEPQNRDWALGAGKQCFEAYKLSGALGDLMVELGAASQAPRFEFDLHGVVEGHREGVTSNIGGVIFLGKPDLHFKNREGNDVVFDWKVNGFCGKAATSPKKGYTKIRDGWLGEQSRYNSQAHKDAFVTMHMGMMINVTHMLEDVDLTWAAQLSTYSWLLGMPVGSEFIVAIDQLACAPGPRIRVAEHRTRISDKFQFEFFAKAQHVWDVVHSDHIFRDVSIEESKSRCQDLDDAAKALSENEWINTISRSSSY